MFKQQNFSLFVKVAHPPVLVAVEEGILAREWMHGRSTCSFELLRFLGDWPSLVNTWAENGGRVRRLEDKCCACLLPVLHELSRAHAPHTAWPLKLLRSMQIRLFDWLSPLQWPLANWLLVTIKTTIVLHVFQNKPFACIAPIVWYSLAGCWPHHYFFTVLFCVCLYGRICSGNWVFASIRAMHSSRQVSHFIWSSIPRQTCKTQSNGHKSLASFAFVYSFCFVVCLFAHEWMQKTKLHKFVVCHLNYADIFALELTCFLGFSFHRSLEGMLGWLLMLTLDCFLQSFWLDFQRFQCKLLV